MSRTEFSPLGNADGAGPGDALVRPTERWTVPVAALSGTSPRQGIGGTTVGGISRVGALLIGARHGSAGVDGLDPEGGAA